MNNSNTDIVDVLDTQADIVSSQKPFDHDRYEIIKKIDRGCWGIAYDVHDNVTNSEMVAKDFDPTQVAQKQLKERKLTLNDVIRNEYTEMRAPDGIVPTWIEKDKNGKLFLVMPKYEKDFESVITTNKDKKYLDNWLSLNDILKWGSDIATSIAGYHKEYNEAHCDIKPDNIFVDKKRKLWLGDSGTSTGTSQISFDVVRSNMGFMYTRAPENFRKDARPNESSDVWAFGSLMYRMFTGKYLLEDELDNAVNPTKYIEGLDEKISKVLLNNKLKKVPKPFRKFLKKSLTFNRHYDGERYADGMEMKKAWEETIADLNPTHFWIKQAKKYLMPALATGIILSGVIYASKLKPDEVTMPKSEIKGQMYITEGLPKNHLVFERDTILPQDALLDGVGIIPSDNMIRSFTKNIYAAHLLKAHIYVVNVKNRNRDIYTDAQFKTYMAYTSPEERQFAHDSPVAIMAKSLEVAITKSKTPAGTIDLEDVFAIARLGEEKVTMARRISGSFDWKNYSKATGSDGQPIVPMKEQNFINECLRYVNLE